MILLLAYFICRMLFLLFNPGLASAYNALQIASVFYYGLRFDIFAIFISNAFFILGHIIPSKKFYTQSYQKMLLILFYAVNIPALFLNCIDFLYFGFTQKRTTADLFTTAMAADIKFNLGIYIRDFWYLLVILAAMVFLMQWLYRKVKVDEGQKAVSLPKSIAALIISLSVFVIGARGGLQFKPIGMQAASRYVPQPLIPATLNTPFAVIKTLGMKELGPSGFMPEEDAVNIYPVRHTMNHDSSMKKLNVVVIIMESFSREYMGFFNPGGGYTPFLDSLCRHSLVCSNAYANAKRSIEGIPAITASIPHLMDESFISSAYNTNAINGLAGILKSKGYRTAFFHGGNNGTMGLENFSPLAGFDNYFGRNEYEGDPSDYDGNWGIYDGPFFTFINKKINSFHQPFCIAFFSLSSHHPYSIPGQYTNAFPEGPLPILKSIGYSDFALKNFFKEAQKTSWFNNTIFVITADHTGPAYTAKGQTSKGIFEVPVIYYCPSDPLLKGIDDQVTQQTDILPSVLDYLHYSGAYSAFGESVFSPHDAFAINYTNNIYQGINNEYILMFDGENGVPVALYNYRHDASLSTNLYPADSAKAAPLVKKTSAAIQQFRKKMSGNSLLSP